MVSNQGRSCTGKRDGAALVERYTDPGVPAPDDVAKNSDPVRLENQREILWDIIGAGYFDRCSPDRHIADDSPRYRRTRLFPTSAPACEGSRAFP
jgi:hypothetical protein